MATAAPAAVFSVLYNDAVVVFCGLRWWCLRRACEPPTDAPENQANIDEKFREPSVTKIRHELKFRFNIGYVRYKNGKIKFQNI